jgi:putative cardiolipin synthase
MRVLFACLLSAAIAVGCATLPPGADFPKTASTAFDQPAATKLGKQLARQVAAHRGESGVRLFPRGEDGLLLRTQIVRAAERSLDIQYFIFVEDYTGKLLLDSVLRAAERGVRVRLLLDDFNSYRSPQTQDTLAALNNHRNIEIRLFNPLNYRGEVPLLQRIDALANAPRVNHRMHNKLMIADGAIAIVGGRNVADEYFETGTPPIRFGDFDLAVVGAVLPDLSRSFDEYWNSALAIPQEALEPPPAPAQEIETREALHDNRAQPGMTDIKRRLDAGDPLAGVLAGRTPFSWGRATVVADPPDRALAGKDYVSPTARVLTAGMKEVTSELVIISPYFIPGPVGLATIEELRHRNVRVRVLTNSLASTDVPIVHSAYRRYRAPLIDAGVEISEVRPVPGQPRSGERSYGSGASGAPFALHAKAYVFDRKRVFVGSANLDPRSLELNTELGLVIDSPDLARQIIARFEEFATSANSYRVVREGTGVASLRWRTSVDGRTIEWSDEPDTTPWQRFKLDLQAMLPIENQL